MGQITLIDFKCEECDHEWEHCFSKKDDIVNSLKCPECNNQALRVWSSMNWIHPTHSSMYGKFEPCFGEVVESRSHKQELLKKYDVIESSDPVGGSRCYRTDDHKPALSHLDKEIEFLPTGTEASGPVPEATWISSPDDAKE